jgi:hypothetical protein
LDVAQLEELAAASQALVDRATAMVMANTRALPSGGLPVDYASRDDADATIETPLRPDIEEA